MGVGSVEEAFGAFARVASAPGTTESPPHDAAKRVGPARVVLHRPYCAGTVELDASATRTASRSNFATVRTNAAVFGGRFMYEAVVMTGGLAQVGWAALSCKFTASMGVGDVALSYAYDGHRLLRWHLESQAYGLEWRRGDVVGCCFDGDARTLSFWKNGVDMGVAFEGIDLGPNIAYFPAASLSVNEGMRFNFGETPFFFPVPGYDPVFGADQLMGRQVAAASKLLSMLETVILATAAGQVDMEQWAVLCGGIWRFLAGLLGELHVVASVLIPAVRRLAASRQQLSLFVDSMTLFSSDASWTLVLERLLQQFGFMCFSQINQGADLDVVRMILESSKTVFNAFFSLPRCHFLMEDFLTLTDPDLREQLKHPVQLWSRKRCPTDGSAEAFEREIETLHARLTAHEARMVRLAEMLFASDAARAAEFYTMLVARNLDIEANPLLSSNESVLVNAFFIVLKLLDKGGVLDTTNASRYVPLRCILQTPVEMRDLIRLGGLMSHLQKESPIDETVLPPVSPDELHIAALVDAMLMLFHLVVNRRLRQADTVFHKVREHSKQLAAHKPVDDGVRAIAWGALTFASPQKQLLLCRALGYVVRSMEHVSNETPLAFGYFPQYYLEFTLDSFRPLFFGRFPRFDFSANGTPRAVLDDFVTFLVAHVNDARVANPEIRDVLMQQMNHFLSTSRFATAAARNATGRERLLRVLMANANRNWVAVSSVFLRFWKGKGFGKVNNAIANPEAFSNDELPLLNDNFFCFADRKSAPDNSVKRNSALASPTFQRVMEALCATDNELTLSYLNQLFNTLNWCVSEFSVGMSDYKTASERKKDTVQIQKKVIIMFELSANLVRLLEIVCMCGGSLVFLAPSAKVNLQRAAETILSVLDRTILLPEKKIFQMILVRQGLGSEINDNVMCHGALGVLLCLFKEENSAVPTVLSEQATLTEAMLTFLETTKWKESLPENASAETGAWIGLLPKLVAQTRALLDARQARGLKRVDSLEVCPICYAEAIDTRFLPCQHTSCAGCITRHLLNSRRCFFCNAEVESTELIANQK